MPEVQASVARLGGLSCAWIDDSAAYLGLTVVPSAKVGADVAREYAEFGCYGWLVCGRGEERDGVWVLAQTDYRGPNEPSPEEIQAMSSAVDGVMASVFAQPADRLQGIPATPEDEWWTPITCDALAPAVTKAAGMTSPEEGFPGDNVPGGPEWEILTDQGVTAWCAWYEYSGQDSIVIDLQIQSGVGAPTADQLAAANAEAISVPGADVAYRVAADPGNTRSVGVLAIVGPNRLLVGGSKAEDAAAAALSVLGG